MQGSSAGPFLQLKPHTQGSQRRANTFPTQTSDYTTGLLDAPKELLALVDSRHIADIA